MTEISIAFTCDPQALRGRKNRESNTVFNGCRAPDSRFGILYPPKHRQPAVNGHGMLKGTTILLRTRTLQTHIGEAGAVNRELEVRFGNRVNGLKLVERGPETEAVVDALETWIEKCPGDIILEKWVHDILEAAQSVILAAGKALPKACELPNQKAKASKKKKIKIVESDVSVMHLYTDAEHSKPAKGKGGAKVDPLMDLLSVNTYLKSDPKKMIVRCSGAEYGCANLTLRDRVRTAMAKESLAEDGSSKVDSFDGEDFDAASIINLNSRKLVVDVLADKDLAPAAPRSTVVLPPASTIVQERVLTEADWDME
ncbi:hypothetical protein DFJ58DRAFT_744888 [Suillus subalutaceus]|uniref:uncharacterized protein n=1 Tax=Suillus subalutaceus TaxID=48586 RepID=UPI001B886EB1|nr:uncharacterized protein DFJ58DRAFT_744888 [Suillus subalutaceus]KAG1858405.1 hypothetical protein DFJ58DRAFT_744888 [Suillus subalutaceus]